MSVQLRSDEALEALQLVDPDSAARWEAILCAATTAIGAELARIHDCEHGEATMEGKAFGGICVPMNPKRPGQPLPEGWDFFDDGGREEWEGEAERLAQEAGAQVAACQNCDWRGHQDECQPIKHYGERVSAGEAAPCGECPECGALAHLEAEGGEA